MPEEAGDVLELMEIVGRARIAVGRYDGAEGLQLPSRVVRHGSDHCLDGTQPRGDPAVLHVEAPVSSLGACLRG
eukprot:4541275-Heterocapsa_arctica.AAC.1